MSSTYLPLPARHDHVGSLLRPLALLEERARYAAGKVSNAALLELEDRCIVEAVQMQQSIGLKSITDGELRRLNAHNDFMLQLHGVLTKPPVGVVGSGGRVRLAPPVIRVIDRLRRDHPILRPGFEHLQRHTAPGHTPKVTLPAPFMLHFRGGRAGISPEAYPALEPDFFDDVVDIYAAELQSLGEAGCRYVQFDAPDLAFLCDAKMREAARHRGDNPDQLPAFYAQLMNRVIARKPAGMLLALHICRGNFRSTWAASGGYEPVAEAVLQGMDFDAYLLEYDDARSGDFTPLRFLPSGKTAVLGLVSTKVGTLESTAAIARRVDEAATIVPMSQLALSPQCGFATTHHGNHLSFEAQRAKLQLVVDAARLIWGD